MKVRLNLATAPLVNHRRFLAGAGVVALVALAALGILARYAYLGWHANRELRTQISAHREHIQELRDQQEQLSAYFKKAEMTQLLDRAAFLNGLISQRSFPWTQIFMDLEKLLPAGVRVISISPRMKNGRVEVTMLAGAVSDDAKLKFLKALDESKQFSEVQVKGETYAVRTTEADPVQMELVAWYTTGAP